MPSSKGPEPDSPRPPGRRYWTAYFDALATGPLLAKPHTARRRAGEVARLCPYPEISAAGLERVKTALASRSALTTGS